MINTARNALESIVSLYRALDENTGMCLDGEESERNIADNIVSITGYSEATRHCEEGILKIPGKRTGPGLMITRDGFVITPYHFIMGFEDEWGRINMEELPSTENVFPWLEYIKTKYSVVTKAGDEYPIDVSCWAVSPSLDIALIKAVILTTPEPARFRLAMHDLQVDDEVRLLGLAEEGAYNQGKVTSSGRDAMITDAETGDAFRVKDTFLTDARGTHGFSGLPFMTPEGEFAGVASYMIRDLHEDFGIAGGIKVRNISNFVKKSAYDIKAGLGK